MDAASRSCAAAGASAAAGGKPLHTGAIGQGAGFTRILVAWRLKKHQPFFGILLLLTNLDQFGVLELTFPLTKKMKHPSATQFQEAEAAHEEAQAAEGFTHPKLCVAEMHWALVR